MAAIVPVVQQAMRESGAGKDNIDAVAVTSRPGLLGSLLVGVTGAKALAWVWSKPLVEVHHIEAHIYAALMSEPNWSFPYATLVVSGGHTSLYRTDSPLDHQLLGRTRDDAAGEALDKAAAMLGLGYPGGPAVEKAAVGGNPKAYPFKRPLLDRDSLDFSFSGLKTALLYTLRGPGGRGEPLDLTEGTRLTDLAASYEAAVADTLAEKCARACIQHRLESVLVGGGVARNQRLRATLTARGERSGFGVSFAAPEFCTDNAAMIAGIGKPLFDAGRVAGMELAATPR